MGRKVRTRRLREAFALFCAPLVFCLQLEALAQEGAGPAVQGDVTTLSRALSIAFGLPEGSEEIRLITSGQAYKPAEKKVKENLPREYYRFDEGVPLEEFLADLKGRPRSVEDALKESNRIADDNLKIMREAMKAGLDYPAPPVCKTSNEEEVESADGGSADIDMLFVRKPLPGDPAELVGRKTEVSVYSGDAASPAHQKFRTFSVPCVPFRMRIAGGKVSRYFGAHALKMFEGERRGRISQAMMSYLSEEMEGGGQQ